MNLIIDIGNTTSKIAFFEKDKLLKFFIIENIEEISNIIENNPYSNAIVSSVKDHNLTLHNALYLGYKTKIPFQNEYKTPKTLGVDRIAGVAGGKKLFPSKDLLVIDMGTCITYDFLFKNKYKGGAISPGIQTKFNSLHTFTDKLPLITPDNNVNLIGSDTKSSIMSGVINGTIAEINGTIADYKRISDNLAVILCGGDAKHVKNQLKYVDMVEDKLVLIGLNEILKYNVK